MGEGKVDPALRAQLERLDALGWFEPYTEGDPRAACHALFEDGVPAHWCVPSFLLDIECIYGEGDHTEVVEELVRSSHGILGRPRVVETWGGDASRWPVDAPVTVELHLESGEVLSASWVQEGDVVSDAFANLLLDFVESHGAVIEEIEPGQWVVGDPVLVDELLRVGRRLDRQARQRDAPPPEPRSEAVADAAPSAAAVPTMASAEELRAWWLFRAGFFLAGRPMATWTMMFGDKEEELRETYLDAMNEAFEQLPEPEQHALVAREISEAAQALQPAAVADAMGMSVEEVYELARAAQEQLRRVGERVGAAIEER